jgi:hypothetical protein
MATGFTPETLMILSADFLNIIQELSFFVVYITVLRFRNMERLLFICRDCDLNFVSQSEARQHADDTDHTSMMTIVG